MKDNKIFSYRVYWSHEFTSKNRTKYEPGITFNRSVIELNDHFKIIEIFVSDVTCWGRDFRNEHEIKDVIRKNYSDTCGKILRDDEIKIRYMERRI